jgi:4-diphosphocytidyl-2-C-methyl-D-erythritol kinase
MTTELRHVLAPAKVNLFLHVTGRRPDGFHLLQSVFMLLDWADELNFAIRPDGHISRQDLTEPGLPHTPSLPDNDLVVRAAKALQAATGCTQGAHIELIKRLPQQAGLGGGSSDAASTLLALNRLWQLGLNPPQLMTLGAQLGADVPFFLLGHNAWVEGVGEQLTPIELPPAKLLVIKPPEGVSTPSIFASPALPRNTKRVIISDFAALCNNAVQSHQAPAWMQFGTNDLQAVVSQLCPSIYTGLEWLHSQGLLGRMTGSGSALFAWATHEVDTSSLPAGWQAHHCNNLSEHPLLSLR